MTVECLERATAAYLRPRGRDEAIEDVRALAAYGVFSNKNLQAITGLNEHFVATFTEKQSNVGGRLNPVTLPLMLQLHQDWSAGVRNEHVAREIVKLGTSRGMLSRLTGIPYGAVTWLCETKRGGR